MFSGAVDPPAGDEAILGLGPIGARVHAQRAADRARNAAQEGEAADPALAAWSATFISRALAPASTLIVDGDFFKPLAEADRDACQKPAVAQQKMERHEARISSEASRCRRNRQGRPRRPARRGPAPRTAGFEPCEGASGTLAASVPRRSGISSRKAGRMSGKAMKCLSVEAAVARRVLVVRDGFQASSP